MAWIVDSNTDAGSSSLSTWGDIVHVKLEEGGQGNLAWKNIMESILYTGPDGESVLDLSDGGYLPYITAIAIEGFAMVKIPGSDNWAGTPFNLYRKYSDPEDERYGNYRPYYITASADQDEVIYKDDLPIWSKYSLSTWTVYQTNTPTWIADGNNTTTWIADGNNTPTWITDGNTD